MEIKTGIIGHFSVMADPRVERTRHHNLIDILVIAICGVISGCENWVEIVQFGEAKKEWLSGFLELPDGIPSHDTFGRVFSLIDPEQFQNCFLSWIKEISCLTEGEVIAIDGKTLRGSQDRINGKSPIHIVSAWASENQLILGQRKVNEKSNEITAIPELLKLLEVKNCIITLDAMGCQTEIVERIVEKGADYVIALKKNQGGLYDDVIPFLDALEKNSASDEGNYEYFETIEKDHGRIETRRYWTLPTSEWLIKTHPAWKQFNSIALVISQRNINGLISTENRYYISSLKTGAKRFANAIRSHWKIENQFHWTLDVAFREDLSRIRKDFSPQNFAVLRHIALNLIKQENSGKKKSVQVKRKLCGWDNSYLQKVIWGI